MEGREFKLWVANSGEPVPEAAMPRRFEPLFRGEVRNGRTVSDQDCISLRRSRKRTAERST